MLRIILWRGKWFFALIFFFVLTSSALTRETDDNGLTSSGNSIPVDIQAKLESNASALDPISLVWTQQKKTPLSEKQLSETVKTPHDYGILEQSLCVFMWQDKKGYFSETCKNSIRLTGGDEKKVSVHGH